MADRIISHERESALLRLLDDPSQVVQDALVKEFQRLGPSGISILQKVAQGDAGLVRDQARQILGKIVEPDPSRQLVEFIRSLRYDLETGLLLINRVIFPGLEVNTVRRGLDKLANRCKELRVMPMSPREQCKLMNRVIFHEYGFRGNNEEYEDPLNSCLEAVCRRRKGLPVTLSALYILIGQRIGLELEPIGLPGHFMVGCFQGEHPFYIDPFERGRFRDVEEIRLLLESQHVSPEFYHLVPVPVGEVLCRVCRNLVAHFDNRNQPRWANRFRTFVREFEETHRRRSEA
jgi:regulator of sirC expression with transglutaminase-like and TPR domain